jgi:hypothetical protein
MYTTFKIEIEQRARDIEVAQVGKSVAGKRPLATVFTFYYPLHTTPNFAYGRQEMLCDPLLKT